MCLIGYSNCNNHAISWSYLPFDVGACQVAATHMSTLDIEAKRSERAQDDTPLPVKELELGSPEKREKA